MLSVYLDPVKSLQGVWVNGKTFEVEVAQRTRPWTLHYYNVLPEGIELTLQLSSEEALKMRVVDQSYGLPELPESSLGSRPGGIIPAPVVYNDATVVSKSFSY